MEGVQKNIRQVSGGFADGLECSLAAVIALVCVVAEAVSASSVGAIAIPRRPGVLPGVVSAGVTSILPLSELRSENDFSIDGEPGPAWAAPQALAYRMVHPGYFRAMGIPIIAGRAFGQRDTATSPAVAIVSRAAERKYWHGASALGGHILLYDGTGRARRLEIVGIAGDSGSPGRGGKATVCVFLPIAQATAGRMRSVAVPSFQAAAPKAGYRRTQKAADGNPVAASGEKWFRPATAGRILSIL